MSEDASLPRPIADFDGILGNLERQREHYDALLVLSERERAAIGAADLAQLAQVLAAKEQLVAQVQALEQQRRAACERFARDHALAAPPDLRTLRRHAPADATARLAAVSVALSDRLARLRRLNVSNARLIAQVQQISQRQIDTLLRYAGHPLYDQHGDRTTAQHVSVICDYRA